MAVVRYALSVVCCLPFTVCCLLGVVCCLLVAVCCLRVGACCLLGRVRCAPLVASWLLLVVC